MDWSKTESYGYELPEYLIAKSPADPRDSSRLMVLRRNPSAQESWIEHHHFYDLPKLLPAGALLVANRSKVIPARFRGVRVQDSGEPGGRIEVLLLRALDASELLWEVVMASSGKQRAGFKVRLQDAEGVLAPILGHVDSILSTSEQGVLVMRFDRNPIDSGLGELPLPSYISEGNAPKAHDLDRYQTVYAKERGSAAAPTAGLHFTDRTFTDLKARGIDFETLLLHVGLGTFRPVQTADIAKHSMHEEHFEVSEALSLKIASAKREKRPICAVGTTSVRALESSYLKDSQTIRVGQQSTKAYFYPGSDVFHVVDVMLTNFHLPKSSLIMLVSAFLGPDKTKQAYEIAVREKYRFYSYGDAMLIL